MLVLEENATLSIPDGTRLTGTIHRHIAPGEHVVLTDC